MASNGGDSHLLVVITPLKDPPAEIKREKLHVVTYNIFFSEFFTNERFDHILKLLQEISADVICLQEGSFFIYQN